MNIQESRYYTYNENPIFEMDFNDYKKMVLYKLRTSILEPFGFCVFYLDGFKVECYFMNSLRDFNKMEWKIFEYCSLFETNTKTMSHFLDKYDLMDYIEQTENNSEISLLKN